VVDLGTVTFPFSLSFLFFIWVQVQSIKEWLMPGRSEREPLSPEKQAAFYFYFYFLHVSIVFLLLFFWPQARALCGGGGSKLGSFVSMACISTPQTSIPQYPASWETGTHKNSETMSDGG